MQKISQIFDKFWQRVFLELWNKLWQALIKECVSEEHAHPLHFTPTLFAVRVFFI